MKTSALWLALAFGVPAWAQEPVAPRACELTFASTTWWPLYRGFTGEGTIRCRDGRSLRVHVVAQGHGLSIDHWRIAHGTGRYSQLASMDDALGHFVRTRDRTHLVRDGRATAPENVRPRLALAGQGQGFDADDAIDDLRIERADR